MNQLVEDRALVYLFTLLQMQFRHVRNLQCYRHFLLSYGYLLKRLYLVEEMFGRNRQQIDKLPGYKIMYHSWLTKNQILQHHFRLSRRTLWWDVVS